MGIDRINILLILLKTNKSKLADEIGERREIVTLTLNGQRQSRRVRDKIVRYIRNQITVQSLFESPSSEESLRRVLPADWVPSESIERPSV